MFINCYCGRDCCPYCGRRYSRPWDYWGPYYNRPWYWDKPWYIPYTPPATPLPVKTKWTVTEPLFNVTQE